MRLTCRLVLATCAAILASACASFRGASIRVPAEPGTAGETTAQVSQQEISTVTEVVDGIATQHQLERATLPERSFKEPDGQPRVRGHPSPAHPGLTIYKKDQASRTISFAPRSTISP